MEEQKAGAGLTTGDRYLVQLLDYLRLWELGKDGGVHQPVITDYEGQLAKMYLYLTFSCPNRCWFCYADGGRRTCSELSPGDFARIVRQGVEAGFESVVLLGGEPLVYSGFSQLIREIQSIDRGKTQIVLRSSLSMPLGDELLVQICNTFDRIVTSIDGNEERHDSIRGKGRYACTLDNLRRGIALGKAEFSVNSVMSAEDFSGEQGKHVRALCDELGITRLTIQSPVPLGRAQDHQGQRLYWKKTVDPLGLKGQELFKTSCGLGHNLYIEPDGKTYPCYAWCSPEHQLGDLSRESVAQLLSRRELLEIMNHGVDTNRKCKTCEVRYLCGGKCKIYVNDKHDIDSPDFDCAEKKAAILKEAETYSRFLFGAEKGE
ncbi:MAG: radical SAM protein [Clostridia bacterium]